LVRILNMKKLLCTDLFGLTREKHSQASNIGDFQCSVFQLISSFEEGIYLYQRPRTQFHDTLHQDEKLYATIPLQWKSLRTLGNSQCSNSKRI